MLNSIGDTMSNRRPRGLTDRCIHNSYVFAYTEDELEFIKAMDRYKRENNKPFPTLTEVLSVLKSLGYRKETSNGT